MKENNIHLEIIESSINSKKNKIKEIDEAINETKNNTINNVNVVNQDKKKLLDLSNRNNSIIHQLKKETFKQKIIPSEDNYVYEKRYFSIYSSISANYYCCFKNNMLNIPFSSIEKVNNSVFLCKNDLVIYWRTKGNFEIAHGLTTWKKNKNDISNFKIHKKKSVEKDTTIKQIPDKEFLSFEKIEKNTVKILDKKYTQKWIDFSDVFLFKNSPIKKINKYVYCNSTNETIQLDIHKTETTNYTIYKWINLLQQNEIYKNVNNVLLKPYEHFSIHSNTNLLKLRFKIHDVKINLDENFISDWTQTTIKKDTYFAFLTYDKLGYQIKINYSEALFNGIENIKKINLEKKTLERNIKEKIVNIQTNQLVLELKQKQKKDLHLGSKIENEKKNTILITEQLKKNANNINNIKNKILDETNLENANKMIQITKAIHKQCIEFVNKTFHPMDFKDSDYEFVKNNLDDGSIIETINTNYALIKKYIKDIEYQIYNIKQIETNLKNVLVDNWIKETTQQIKNTKTFEKKVKNSIQQLKTFITEKKINDIELNEKFNIILSDYSSIILKINKITEKRQYYLKNEIESDELNLLFKKGENIIDTLKNDIETIKIDIQNYNNRKRNIVQTELEKIENIKIEIENENKKILTQQQEILENEKNYNNTINIYNDILGKIQIITDYEKNIKKNIKDPNIFNDITNIYETTNNLILEINSSIIDISNIHTNLLNSIKNTKNVIGDILYDEQIKTLNEIETSINDKTIFDKNTLVQQINTYKKNIDELNIKMDNLSQEYKSDTIKTEIQKSTLLISILNKKQSITIYYKYSQIETKIKKVIENDNKCNDFAMDIIDYTKTNTNFFEKLKNTNDKYKILLSYCETTNNSFIELKNFMSNVIDEINCIKNDMDKIKYFLDLISPSNTKINDLKLDLSTSSKLVKQVESLKKNLEKQKTSLNEKTINKIEKINYILDPIVVPNTDKNFFRSVPSEKKNKKRAIFTNGLPQIGINDELKFIMRYVYWPESILVSNLGHSPQNDTVENGDNDIGMLGFKYTIKNNMLYIEFYRLNEQQPYEFGESINIGYYYDSNTNTWYLENSEKTGPNLFSINWFKFWEFNNEPTYKKTKDDFFGWYLTFENNYPNNTTLQGNEENKTLVFDKNKFGKQIDNSRFNSPRQTALLENAALLGWLGVEEQNRIKNIIDQKLIDNTNRKINTNGDFDYSNGEGIFILYPKVSDKGSWRDKYKKNGYTFTDQKEFVFFTIQNNNDESILTFYDSVNDKLNDTPKTLNDIDIIHELKYIEYNNDSNYVLSQKNSGSYRSKNIDSFYFKTDGPDVNGKYTIIEQRGSTQSELIASPYILEKNLSKTLPSFQNNLNNIYFFTNDIALISIHQNKIDEPKTFDDKEYFLELRKMDPDTLEIDKSYVGFISKYIYKPVIGFSSTPNTGKYFYVSNNTVDTNNFIEIIDGSIYPSDLKTIEIKRVVAQNETFIELQDIKEKYDSYKNIEKEKKVVQGNYLITNPLWDENITGNNFNCMKMESINDKLIFYQILNKDFFDIGRMVKQYTFIPRVDYYKYYEVINKKDFSLFPNNQPPPVVVNKIRIESNNPYPLELLNIDVYTNTDFDSDNTPKGNSIKFQPVGSIASFKFKNPKQSSTSNIDHIADNAVNGIIKLDEYSQTEITFSNDLKWFEVELDPPSLITKIDIYSRKNTLFSERANSNVFLIDVNGNKISWSWEENTSFSNLPSNGKKINNGTFASINVDKNSYDFPSTFSNINTIQEIEYYPQTYFSKIRDSFVYRENNTTISIELKEWDNEYTKRQNEKKIIEEKRKKHLIPYNQYVVSNSNWNYNWVRDKKFIAVSRKDSILDDILEIYEIYENNKRGNLYFTYVYKNYNYYLNGDIESNSFFYLPNNEINNDSKSYILYENVNDEGVIVQSDFTSVDLVLQEYVYYIEQVNIKNNKLLQKLKNFELSQGKYLIMVEENNYLLNSLENSFELFQLNSDFNIGDLENKILSIKATFTGSTLYGFDIKLIDINNKEIHDSKITTNIVNNNNGASIIVEKSLEKTERIRQLIFNSLNNSNVVLQFLDANDLPISVKTNVNKTASTTISFDIQKTNIINILDYQRESDTISPDFIFDKEIKNETIVYKNTDSTIQWIYDKKTNTFDTNFDSNTNQKYIVYPYDSKRKQLFDITVLNEKKIRNKLTKTPNIDFIVIGLDKIEAIYDSHPKNYFLLEKINDKLSIFKINNNLEKIDNIVVKSFEWNKDTLFYENDSEYLSELYEPNETDYSWNIIIGDISKKNIYNTYQIQRKSDFIDKQNEELETIQTENLIKIQEKLITVGEYYLSETQKKFVSTNRNDLYSIEVFDITIDQQKNELYKSVKVSTTTKKYDLIKNNNNYNYTLKTIDGYDFSDILDLNAEQLSDWNIFYTSTNNDFKNEYDILNVNLAIVDLESIENQINSLTEELVKNIGGEVYVDGSWKPLLETITQLIEYEDQLNPFDWQTSTLTYIDGQASFNSKRLKDNLYKHIGPELWENEMFKFKNDFNDISELENVVFIPSTANQILLDNYKKKRDELIKNYNDNLRIKDDDYVFIFDVDNDILPIIKSALNKTTMLKYYSKFDSDTRLVTTLNINPNFFQNGLLPHKTVKTPIIDREISRLKNIIETKIFPNDSFLIQIVVDKQVAEFAFEDHYKNGSVYLRETLKEYVDVIFRHNTLLQTFEILKEYGKTEKNMFNTNDIWNFEQFDKDYIFIQKDITIFEGINHKGPYEKEYDLKISRNILNTLFLPNTFRYDDPFEKTNIDKFNSLKNNIDIDNDYKNKLIDFYDKLFNIRRWQITLANRDLLVNTSPTEKIWNSENDVLNNIKEIEDLSINIDLLTIKKWKLIEKSTIDNYLSIHSYNRGSKTIRDNINLFYEKLEKLYTDISELQQSTPIKPNSYLLLFKNKKNFHIEVSANGEMKLFSTGVFSEKQNLISTLKWYPNKKIYENNTETLKIISLDNNYNYIVSFNNETFRLIPLPTFYSYGNNNDFDFSLSENEKKEFYNGNSSRHYNNFQWWINGQHRGMDDKLGTNLNSEFSVAVKALRMPFLIYLRNNILLPLKGVNERKIYDSTIMVRYNGKEGAYSFSKNELIEKRNNLEWWLKEWTKPLHFDENEKIESINKKTDGKVPNSKRWPNVYNTVEYFDNFISDDTIGQWITFLKNTEWSDEIKKNVTHKIIETAMFPIMERITRHMKQLIDFCIKMQEINDKKIIYLNTLSKFIIYNTTNDDEIKTEINKEFESVDLNDLVNTQKQEILELINNYEFQKLYKTIKKINFNEASTISNNERENIPITELMSKQTFGNHDFSSWERYREHGWKSYGHGSCGSWFNSAFDHPDPTLRGNLRFNNELKEIFLNTNQFFDKIQKATGINMEFTDHLRAINNSYAENYWFNDYIYVVELVIKKQYVELLKFENENSAEKIMEIQREKLLSSISDYNKYKSIHYSPIQNINLHHKNNRLYEFGVKYQGLYNNVKSVVDFTECPNNIFLTIDRPYNYSDVSDIMIEPDIDSKNDDSFVAIYKESKIENLKDRIPLLKIQNIRNYKKIVDYSGVSVVQYTLPNKVNLKRDKYTIVLYNKSKGNTKEKIFSISEYKFFSPSKTNYNEQNIYLSFFKNIDNNKLLVSHIEKMIDYIDNEIKNNILNDIITFFKNEKTLLEKEKFEAQRVIINSGKKYETYRNIYKNRLLKDPLSMDKWNKKNMEIDREKEMIDSKYNTYLIEKTKWNNTIAKLKSDISDYNLFYEKNKSIIENTNKYIDELLGNISLINITNKLEELSKNNTIYNNVLDKIQAINKKYGNDIFDTSKNKITNELLKTRRDTTNIINKIIDIKKFPFNEKLKTEKTYNDFYDELSEKMKNRNKLFTTDNEIINNDYKKYANVIKELNVVSDTLKNVIEVSHIQKNLFLEYKSTYGRFDFYNIYFKNSLLDINKKYNNAFDKYKILLEKYNKKIKNKTENFKNNDLNVLNQDLIDINKDFGELDKNILLFDDELLKYEVLKTKTNRLKFTMENVDTYIANKDVNTLENLDSKNIYINMYLLKNSNDQTKKDINLYLEKRALYNLLKKYTNDINEINIKLPEKVKLIVDNLVKQFNEQYAVVSKFNNDILIEKTKHKEFFYVNINDLLYKIYNKNKNGNTYDISINGVQKTYIYNKNEKLYKNVDDTLTVNLFNWEGYTLTDKSLQSDGTYTTKKIKIKNTDTSYYTNINNLLSNIVDDKKKMDAFLKNIFTKYVVEKNKLVDIKNKIIEYDWFIENIINNIVSDRTQSTIINVEKNEAYILEIDIQNYLFDLYEKRQKKNIEKYNFYKNYKTILDVAKQIENPNDTDNLNSIVSNVINYKNDSVSIYFPNDPDYTFEKLSIKLTDFLNDLSIDLSTILNSYIEIDRFLNKNNSDEIVDIKDKFDAILLEKDKVIDSLNKKITDKKQQLEKRYNDFTKNDNKLFVDKKNAISAGINDANILLSDILLDELNTLINEIEIITNDITRFSDVSTITNLGNQLRAKRIVYDEKKTIVEKNIIKASETIESIDKNMDELMVIINYNNTFINTLINDKRKVYDDSFLKQEIESFTQLSRSNINEKNILNKSVNDLKKSKTTYLETFTAL